MKSVLQDNDNKPWMFRILLRTFETHGTKSKGMCQCEPKMAPTSEVPQVFFISIVIYLLVWSFISHHRTILKPASVMRQNFRSNRSTTLKFGRLYCFGSHRRPISSWQKHGYVCFLLPPSGLTIC